MIRIKNSLSSKWLSMILVISILLGVVSPAMLSVFALTNTNVAQIGDTYYESLDEAIASVPSGSDCVTPETTTEIKLLTNTESAFDVGKSNGSVTKNISIDLGGNTLTLKPAVGSVGTISNGIRVLAYSKLTISNGTIACSDETDANIKTGIANYSDLTLENVTVKSGALTRYTINNRGKLTLLGKTTVENGQVAPNDYSVNEGKLIAITNDPYNLYYTTNVDAAIICDSADVSVGTVQIERYERKSSNKGVVKLDISNGNFDRIIEDGNNSVNVSYDLTGGTIGVYNGDELTNALNMVTPGAEYVCPENSVTIKLMGDGTFANGFDVGTSNGKAPKNIVLDLNGKTLTLKPAVGSVGTVSNGIRVLAYSKLHVKNGTLVCPDDVDDNIKTGIANYSDLTLEDVTVKSGALTRYTINNRGKLTLLGKTTVENGQVAPNDYDDMTGELVAITNDPYTTYQTTNENNASLICKSKNVVVGNIQLECYGKSNKNIILDIANGTFGKIMQPKTSGNITVNSTKLVGGTFANDVSEYLAEDEYGMVFDERTQTYAVQKLTEVSDFAFETAIPEDQWVGAKYTNIAKSKTSNGKVTYAITSGSDIATIDANTGEVSFNKLGKITVTATIEKTNKYKSATAQYTVTSVKKDHDDFAFKSTNPEITYDSKNLTYKNEIKNIVGNGKIVYEIISGSDVASIDSETGKLIIKKAGSVTVKATKSEDDLYNKAEASYTLTINYAEQSVLTVIAPETITYNTTAQGVLEVSGGDGDGKVSYSIIEGSQFATIDADGNITTIKASETSGGPCGVITIQVDKAGDDCYKVAIPVTIAIDLKYADQTGFDFEETATEKLVVTYNDNDNKFINKASGGQSTGETIYEVTNGFDVADIDSETGELTIKKAGNVTVKATKSGDTCYNATDETYTLIVNPDTPEFTVADNAESVELIYGVKEYDIDVNTTLGGSGKYIYSLDGENKIGAFINDKYTGKITFGNSDGKVGSITVKVKKEADDCYIEDEKTFTLTISYHIPTAQPTLSGEIKNNSGWYTSDVTITAPDEYQISYSNELEGTIWSDSVTVDKEGKNSKNVYLKKGNEISGAISFEDIKIDKSVPYDVVIKYSESVNVIDKLLNVITFGFYSSEKPLIVTVSAKDNIDIDKIECIAYDVTEGSDKGKASIESEKTLVSDEEKEYGTTSGHIQFKVDPQYRGKIKAIVYDCAGNTTEVTENDKGFDEVVVDSISPEVKVEFDGSFKDKIDVDISGEQPTRQSKNMADEDTRFVYNGDITATITVKEANFFNDMIITVYRDGKEVTDFKTSDWKQTDGTLEYVKTVTMSEDGDYQIKLDYKDKSGNKMNVDATSEYADKKLKNVETYVSNIHTIDTTAPTYSIVYDNKSVVENFDSRDYFDANRTATIKVTDRNFRPNEVDFKIDAKDTNGDNVSEFTYSKLTDWKEWIYDGEDTWKAEVSFDADANYDVTFNYKDIAENEIEQSYSTKFTVDTKSSEIDITYIAYNGNTNTHYTKDDSVDAANFKSATQVYYNGKVTAKITVNEANFFEGDKYTNETNVHKIGILLTKIDNDGNITKTEYLPENSEQFFAVEATNTEIVKWNTDTTNKNVHTFEIAYEEDTDYVLTVKGTDFSKNVAKIRESIDKDKTEFSKGNSVEVAYTSKTITVDTIAPEVTVVYDNNDVKATHNSRTYFTENRVATITVKEHNFRASDFVVKIAAKYSDNTDVAIADFVNLAKNKDNWVKDKNSDVYTIKFNFTVDANYTFGYTYKDLAQNSAKAFKTVEFTVDKENPDNLTVTYDGDVKTTVLDKVLNVITFGYYDAKVKVIITADDAVSGIEHFVYSYVKSENASDVNAGLENVTINSDNITQDGKTFTASFEIPKDVLQNTNQFNGTVKFTAFDRSARNSERKETSTIVVDNIAPRATITYNEPVQKVNDISYYAGNIDAKIVITEANFNSDEVVVKVNDNSVNVKWTDNSVDVHTGTFTLTEDGDYVVTVEYKDRSANEMAKYTSNRLTLDTKAPAVNVTNVKQNSANKDEKYEFTITAKDINLDATSFKPVLTAVILNENGSFSNKNIPLGDIITVKAGEEYKFAIDNLVDDAIYTLVCTVEDMSDNKYSKIILSDGKEYENVSFSINRNGSTYAIGKETAELIEKYYVQNVTDDVVIVETNVDTLKEFNVTLNGAELVKDKDYTVTESGGGNQWFKYTYTVDKTLFANEGEYKLVVSSKDKAENDAFSDVKDATINFVVDRTAPIVTITGMAKNGRYQTESQKVTIVPTDDGGALKSLIVRLVDGNGKVIKEIVNLTGETLEKALEDGAGKIEFTLTEGMYQNIQIICNDCAVDEDGNTNTYDETVTNVTVTPNGFMIFWANKPLRWGSIAGVILLSMAIISFVVFKKRKKR